VLAGQEGIPGIYSVLLLSNSSTIQYLNYAIGPSNQPINSELPIYPLSAGFAGRNPISVQWARLRASPPNGMMPAVAAAAAVTPVNVQPYSFLESLGTFEVLAAAVAIIILLVGLVLFMRRRRPGGAALEQVRPSPAPSTPREVPDSGDPIAVLKLRYARGEMTKEQYLEALKTLKEE
jgi:uncharacterized membrane protein